MKKNFKKKVDAINKSFNELVQSAQWSGFDFSNIDPILARPMTKRERLSYEKRMAKIRKEQKIAEAKEKRRRAKKITITVGELEDQIEEAKDSMRDYD